MKTLVKGIATVILLLIYLKLVAQVKKPIDVAFMKSQKMRSQDFRVSENGKFTQVVYENNQVMDSVVLRSTGGRLIRKLTDNVKAVYGFTSDSKWYVYAIKDHDSIAFYNLEAKTTDTIPGTNVKFVEGSGYTYFVIAETDKRFSLYEPNARRVLIKGKGEVSMNSQGNVLVVEEPEVLRWIMLPELKETIVKKDGVISQVSFDPLGKRAGFTMQHLNKVGLEILLVVLNLKSGKLDTISTRDTDDLRIVLSQPWFSKNGRKLYFKLADSLKFRYKDSIYSSLVDVWNYKDYLNNSQQSLAPKAAIDGTGIYDFQTGQIKELRNDTVAVIPGTLNNEKFLLTQKSYRPLDYYWRDESWQSLTVQGVSGTFTKNIIDKTSDRISDIIMSPDEKYVVWFNGSSKKYFCYEIATGTCKVLTTSSDTAFYEKYAKHIFPYGVAGWSAGDTFIYIYDKNDVWQFDPGGVKKPRNLTNQYGEKNRVIFRFVKASNDRSAIHNVQSLLLAAFDETKKDNGFWKINSRGNPTKLTMQSYLFWFPPLYRANGTIDLSDYVPRKLKFTNKYLVKKENASEGKYYLLTEDFIKFKEIFHQSPPKGYRWLTDELRNYVLSDGKVLQGILYKPDDFDPRRKYPVIFDYYEKRSDELHRYHNADFSSDRINIPFYVSNNYLVFVPDISFKEGELSNSIVECVESAAKYLSTFPWVDSRALGLQGHSFGGYETNCLVAHSRLFSAACTAAGSSNLTSAYGQQRGSNYKGADRSAVYEVGFNRGIIGPPLYKKPNLYMENSPVFYLKNVTTPLLLMHNKGDGAVPFAQALEMFFGLRRAHKKVWLLQYDGEDHGVGGDNAIDYTIRMKQFFDYFLLNKPAPTWMTRGVEAYLKGHYSGFDIDESGATP